MAKTEDIDEAYRNLREALKEERFAEALRLSHKIAYVVEWMARRKGE